MNPGDHISKSTSSEDSESSSGSLTDSFHIQENKDITRHICDKIAIVSQRLKATDNNLKLMETLLAARKRTKNQRRTLNSKSKICGNNSGEEEFVVSDEDAGSGTSPPDRDCARSVDSLRAAGTASKSSTFNRLTQSMQDLYRQQRELHEATLRNSRCASADVVRELSSTFKRSVDEESSTRLLAHHLQDIKEEIRIGHFHYATSTVTESLQKELLAVKSRLEELNHQCQNTEISAQTSGEIEGKIADMRKILEQLENQQRVLNGTVEALQSSHLDQRHHNDHLVKVLADLSDKLTRDDHERKLSARDDEDRISAKKLAQRFKAKCSDLSAECKAYHKINEEKERQLAALSHERTEMFGKFEEVNEHLAKTVHKLHLRELEFERERISSESTLKEWKTFHWESQKMMKEANDVIDKLQRENDKLMKEKSELVSNEAVTKEESKVTREMLNKLQVELASTKDSHSTLLTTLCREKEKQNELSLLVENLKQQLALVKESSGEKLNIKTQPVTYCTRENDHRISKLDFDKVLNENLRLQKKWEKLLTRIGRKNDHIREKDERIHDLNQQLQKTKAVMQTMEHEFREILVGIGGDVDRTVQVLTLNSNESYYQALGPLQGVHLHTKVHLVEIKAKLKWLQDEIRSTVIVKRNNLEKSSSANKESKRIQNSVHNPLANSNKDIKSPITSTPYRKENIPELRVKFSDSSYLGHLDPQKMSSILGSPLDLDQSSSFMHPSK